MHLHAESMQSDLVKEATSLDGAHHLFLDGENFNEDLTRPDPAAAILSAYKREGTALFTRMNGSFALVIFEPMAERLTLVCDRIASRPLFYLQKDGLFVYSSRLEPFTLLPNIQAKVNPLSLSNFLACGFVLETNTLLSDVKILGPAQILVLDNGRLSISEYWSSSCTVSSLQNDDDLVDEMIWLINRAVQRQSLEETRIGVPLSGGYDSRVLAGCLHRLRPREAIHTITWGEDENTQKSDAAISRMLAQQIGARHTFFKLKAEALPEHFHTFVRLSEGRTDAVGNYPEGLNIFERIRDDLKVGMLLRGDECFGWKENASTENQMLHSLSIHHLDNFRQSYEYFQPAVRNRLAMLGRDQLLRLSRECPHHDLRDRDHYFFLTQRLVGYLNPLSHLKQLVIPVRSPFMDADILDFVRHVPAHLRESRALFRVASQRMFPELFKFEIARYNNLIDWDIRLGRDPSLRDCIVRILLEHRNGFDELIDRRRLEQFLIQTFAEAIKTSHFPVNHQLSLKERARRRMAHYSGRYDLSPCTQIFRLMILKIWVDEYNGGNCDLV